MFSYEEIEEMLAEQQEEIAQQQETLEAEVVTEEG